MSAFSRGFFLRRQCHFILLNTHTFLPSTRIPQPRLLSTTFILRAITKSTSNPALRQTLPNQSSFIRTKSPTTSTPFQIYQTYASRLAQKPHPTLLYLAPPHAGFIVSSYIMSGFCFSYAVYFFWSNYLNPPTDIQPWVPIAFGGICFFMACAGGFFLLGPAWIVKSITAMPPAALKAAGIPATLAKGATAPQLKIEIELRKMFPLPFFPARKMYVKPEEIQLGHILARPAAKRSAAEIRAIRLQEEAEKEKALEYERAHIMSGPIRHLSRGLFDIVTAARRSWTREGFTKIAIKKHRYKLDVSGGWALDGGKAIDRLVIIKPEP